MWEIILKTAINLLVIFIILEIGANTGGNKGLKRSWHKLEDNTSNSSKLKDIFYDLFSIIIYAGIGVMCISFSKEYTFPILVITFLLEVIFVVAFIRDLKIYKVNHKK